MFGLGVQELLLILVIALIFFGAEKIPQLAKSLGKGIFEFKKAQQDIKNEFLKETEAEAEPASARTIEPTVQLTHLTCPKCQQQTISGSLYCSQCGERMLPDSTCSVCQRYLEPDEKFCPNCGNPREK